MDTVKCVNREFALKPWFRHMRNGGGFSRKTPPLVQDLGWRDILADLRLTSDMEFGDILGVLGSVLRHVESRRAC